ncbi:MAG TPA: SDR family oxidoreductase [Thermoanaerobaculaceae bacterium]|nr:SDR family oxidoreductase [Thermoanaerobaculaceae bacterium]
MSAELFDLRGRVAAVTGALGLLGREHAAALAEAGASLALADLDGEAAAAMAEGVAGRHGVEAIGVGVDVVSPQSLDAFRARIQAHLGRLDVLVNNAAANDRVESPDLAPELTRFEHYPVSEWHRVINVNVTGVFLASQVLGSLMLEQRRGSVINIASTYGVVGPDQSLYRTADGTQTFWKSPAYPASKGAVIAFTRYLAAYWGAAGIRVNALSPGGVLNRQDRFFVANYSRRTPLGRMAAPSDYRGALVFLASDASSYMTGANLVVDGGFTAW